MKEKRNIQEIFTNYLEGNFTKEELKILLDYFDLEEDTYFLKERVRKELETSYIIDKQVKRLVRNVDKRLINKLASSKKSIGPIISRQLYFALSSVAAILLVIGTLWFKSQVVHIENKVDIKKTYTYSSDVLPGSNQATLVLSDGKIIHIGQEHEVLQELDGTNISRENGKIVYQGNANPLENKMLMNTLTVPRAGTYQLVLPDGTKVWLNASSELRFPTNFIENERRVYVKGEAYFEVAKNPLKPFKVVVNETTVEALGTQFNIRAYKADKVQTTLVEGSVKVAAGTKSVILKPGTEANVFNHEINVIPADLKSATSWKEGYFYFKKQNIKVIMNDIALWYNIEINYKGHIPTELYSGSIDRNTNLSQALEMIKEVSNANFQINGNQVYLDFN